MTPALLALVALLAIAAALALVELTRPGHRHLPIPHRRTEDRPMTTHTTDQQQLPDGYADPASLAYVPDELRPYFDAGPLDRLDEQTACDRFEDRARADVAWTDPSVRDRVQREYRYDEDLTPYRVLRVVHGSAVESLPPMTPVERDRCTHLLRLERAYAAHALAERERAAEQSRAASLCAACGIGRRPLGTPTGPGSSRDDIALCQSCRETAQQIRLDRVAGEQVRDGRTRSELVRGWLG